MSNEIYAAIIVGSAAILAALIGILKKKNNNRSLSDNIAGGHQVFAHGNVNQTININSSITQPENQAKILEISEKAFDVINSSLIENEKILTAFLTKQLNQFETSIELKKLFHLQKNRGDLAQYKNYLKVSYDQEKNMDVKYNIDVMIKGISYLQKLFYSYEKSLDNYGSGETSKYFIGLVLAKKYNTQNYLIDDEEAERQVINYLEELRKVICTVMVFT